MTMGPTDGIDLPEYRNNPFIAKLPPVLSAGEALRALADLPEFHEHERLLPAHWRPHCIQRLARYFQPLERHIDLEARFSMLLRQGYISRNPTTGDFVRHLQDGHDRCLRKDVTYSPRPVRSTATSFTLIGCSGVGKSTSIERILELYPQRHHHTEPFSLDQVTWLKLDSPHQGSPKQLCISFFKEMDRVLGNTDYFGKHGGNRNSVDRMMVEMAQVANLHALGVLIIDEIQHLRQARGTGHEALLNFLVTLVNTIGIPVVIIGTLAALPLLQGDFRQARRATGLVWERMEAGPSWNHFVDSLWRYQWLREPTPLTDEIRQVLYEESQGIIDVVVKLFMLAQLHALRLGLARNRPERIDAALLRHVARENFHMIQPMIDALKRNDRAAIAKYDDIRPLQRHVEQTFQQAMASMDSGNSTPPPPSAQASGPAEGEATTTVRQALSALGVAPDLAEAMLAQAAAQGGADDPLVLMANVSAQLRPGAVSSPPPATRRPRRAKDAPPPEDSLQSIVARGKAAGLSGYQALLDAAIIRPPSADLSA